MRQSQREGMRVEEGVVDRVLAIINCPGKGEEVKKVNFMYMGLSMRWCSKVMYNYERVVKIPLTCGWEVRPGVGRTLVVREKGGLVDEAGDMGGGYRG